jgi:hypothetical protein
MCALPTAKRTVKMTSSWWAARTMRSGSRPHRPRPCMRGWRRGRVRAGRPWGAASRAGPARYMSLPPPSSPGWVRALGSFLGFIARVHAAYTRTCAKLRCVSLPGRQVAEPVDALAYIGRNQFDHPNVFIVTGDSGQGLTHSTIASPSLLHRTTNRPPRVERARERERKSPCTCVRTPMLACTFV